MWKELAYPFRVSALAGLLASAYLAWLAWIAYPWLFILLGYFPNVAFSADLSTLFLECLILVFFIGLATIPLGGALGLLIAPMSDSKRGILAFFVTIFSFFPLLFLGLNALGWIFQQWQLAIVALIWIPVLWVTTRTFRRRQPVLRA